jgi:hypothetical protein
VSRIVRWLGKVWYGLLAVLLAWVVITSLWNGWIVPIWTSPTVFLQCAYLIALLSYALVTFIRVDEKYSKRFPGRVGFGRRSFHAAMALGTPIAVLIVGFFTFRGIWPNGLAFDL